MDIQLILIRAESKYYAESNNILPKAGDLLEFESNAISSSDLFKTMPQ